MKKELLKLVDETLHFHYLRGGENTEGVISSSWKTSPVNVLSCLVSGEESQLIFQDTGNTVKRCFGSTLFIPAGTTQRLKTRKTATGLYCWAHLHFTILHDIDLLALLNLEPILFQGKTSQRLSIWLKELARLRELDPRCEKFATIVKMKSLGFSILRIILENSQTAIDITDKLLHLERFSPVFIYINNNLDKKISLGKLAQQVNLSPFHFHRKFKHAVGFSPVEYARHQKIKKAQELLLSTDLTLSEIADELGFSDSFTFSKSFKHYTGFPPKDYRHNINSVQ